MGLETYNKKRNFENTPEPRPRVANSRQHRFVVQEHHASRLHFDFRLEMGGVLKSWAIPKGPSMDPSDKRLAVQVEDHPVNYLRFEGEIAEGNYGAGQVRTWDIGTYAMVGGADPLQAYDDGKLSFTLSGNKLQGQFNLLRMRGKGRQTQWLLIKSQDRFAQEGWQLETLLKNDKPPRAARAKTTPKPRAVSSKRAISAPPRKTKTSANPGPLITLDEFVQDEDLHGSVRVNVNGVTVALTHLEKPYWPDEGITKGELLRYYATVAPTILPYLRDRPLILQRYPNGIDAPFFFQHDLTHAPDYVRRQMLESEEERALDYAIIDNIATLLYLTNLGTIEEHPWNSRVQDLDHPTWLVLDLDPEDAPFDTVCEVAQAIRATLKELGLTAYAKTSGSRGIHIYVPIEPRYSYDEVADFAESAAALVVRENPQCATVIRSLSQRKAGLVYVDHLQNARGKTVAAPYSVRARPGATVSAPLDWREVKKGLDLYAFTIKTLPARLKERGDLFRGVLEKPQSLDRALEALRKKAAKHTARAKPSGSPQPRATPRG